MEKTIEEQYRERNRRVMDAIQLKIPDRVPIEMSFSYFPAKYAGIQSAAAYYDYDAWLSATKKTIGDFAPDSVYWVQGFQPGKVMEYLEPKTTKWPGYGVSPEHGHQAVEGEWMKGDEYDAYFEDPSDYALRVLAPRTLGVMEPFRNFPPLSMLSGAGSFGALALGAAFSRPDVEKSIETLKKAAREWAEWQPKLANFTKEIEKLGFPVGGIGGGAPFDVFSDSLRGMRGTMFDMYERPEQLLKGCRQQLEKSLQRIASMPPPGENPRVTLYLHRGADGFMSLKQFEKFYWPGLKAVILALIEKNYTPCVFFEGSYTQRLEYLLELPRAKVVAHLDSTDIVKAKEILGNHMCIRGNVPATLLQTGTKEDVKAYVKNLIDTIGKDGGLIVCPRSSPEKANPENLKTMIDFTKEYGVYR
jgi:hypothetical protein